MSMQIVVQGTVQSDGTLHLDERVPMPAGRVQVTVQPVVQPPPDDPFWASLERIWAAQKARGYAPRAKQQIDAQIEQLRNEADDEMQSAENLQQKCRQAKTRQS